MEVLHVTSRKRETYRVQLKYSLLWECALGIAAITNTPLINTLEKPSDFWKKTRQLLSEEMLEHLHFVEKNNTWKALLQLLHQQDFTELTSFFTYIENMSPKDLKFICIPYLGTEYQDKRQQAAKGEEEAIIELINITRNNPYFPGYIEFICKADVQTLKEHLIDVMSGWYQAVIEPKTENLQAILKRDCATKGKMQEKMNPEEFVEWATGGVTYVPEPSVHNVLLIPQYIYRPWNIEADIEGTKVFYYPVANESIDPTDKYVPGYFLVQKHKALGDEVRLRIVKMLSENDRTLQDITHQLDIGKSTIHHHLKILRSARLVEIKDSKYRLKKKSVESLAKELAQYINGD